MRVMQRRTSGRVRRAAGALAAALLLGVTAAAPARAGLVLAAPTGVPAAAGTGGNFFDVTLTADGGTDYRVSGFEVTLDVPSGSGVTFTNADTSTTAPYIFPGSTPNVSFEAGQVMIHVADLDLNPPGYVTLNDQTVGLGRIYFSVAAGAPTATVPVTFDTSLDQTVVVDDTLTPYDSSVLTIHDGSIDVTGQAAAVPEPSTLAQAAAGALATALACLRRRRRVTTA